jgi:REP-associated tyrosine transposase
MPRASRHFLPGYVWHITHRCHQRKFLLKFARDRRRYLHWVFEAKKRFALSVLNYVVTSNHIHLLVKDTGQDAIAQSMQLIAGRTAQEYNERKGRGGAFWEDRYHATAIEADEHLHRCLVYIDLNMVRAGVVNHPIQNVLQANTNDLFVRDDPGRKKLQLGVWLASSRSKASLASRPSIERTL